MADRPTSFPDVPWATAISKDYADLGGQVTHDHDNEGGLTHFWEYGQRLDPFQDAEEIRDHLSAPSTGRSLQRSGLTPRSSPTWNWIELVMFRRAANPDA